jgi:ascorbate-specific PTS system EIIC-type component UlaA
VSTISLLDSWPAAGQHLGRGELRAHTVVHLLQQPFAFSGGAAGTFADLQGGVLGAQFFAALRQLLRQFGTQAPFLRRLSTSRLCSNMPTHSAQPA